MLFRHLSVLILSLTCLSGAIASLSQENVLANPATPTSQSEHRAFLLAQRQRRPDRDGSFLRGLNLSQDQIRRIQAIRSQYKTPIAQRGQAFRQAQQELRSLMEGNTASRGQLQEKFRQVEALRQQYVEAQFNSMLEIREVLTPEQRRQFANQMRQRNSNRQNQENVGF